MSYISGYRVRTEARLGQKDETVLVDSLHEGNELFSAVDGEELNAATQVLAIMDALDNGEALVITRTVY